MTSNMEGKSFDKGCSW